MKFWNLLIKSLFLIMMLTKLLFLVVLSLFKMFVTHFQFIKLAKEVRPQPRSNHLLHCWKHGIEERGVHQNAGGVLWLFNGRCCQRSGWDSSSTVPLGCLCWQIRGQCTGKSSTCYYLFSKKSTVFFFFFFFFQKINSCACIFLLESITWLILQFSSFWKTS